MSIVRCALTAALDFGEKQELHIAYLEKRLQDALRETRHHRDRMREFERLARRQTEPSCHQQAVAGGYPGRAEDPGPRNETFGDEGIIDEAPEIAGQTFSQWNQSQK